MVLHNSLEYLVRLDMEVLVYYFLQILSQVLPSS